ncbi:hypothetical protein Trydic_g22333 [Trypoxylus dichotomus]
MDIPHAKEIQYLHSEVETIRSNSSRNSHQWFEENPHAVVESNWYDFLENGLPLLLEEISLVAKVCMFLQQDKTPAYFSHRVIHYLSLTFFGKWINRNGHIHWRPRSPNPTS